MKNLFSNFGAVHAVMAAMAALASLERTATSPMGQAVYYGSMLAVVVLGMFSKSTVKEPVQDPSVQAAPVDPKAN